MHINRSFTNHHINFKLLYYHTKPPITQELRAFTATVNCGTSGRFLNLSVILVLLLKNGDNSASLIGRFVQRHILSASSSACHTSPQHTFTAKMRKGNGEKSMDSRFCYLPLTLENTPVPSLGSPQRHTAGGKGTRTLDLKKAACSRWSYAIYKAFDLKNCWSWSHFWYCMNFIKMPSKVQGNI